ncbi:hypothetical protein [Mesorhizobium sp. CAU 1732]|uniref:hypothetical protein n=1 Tax=Mesorhizobium sp. CAU 1732 TaxID=3140358 RepID=UPI00326003CD
MSKITRQVASTDHGTVLPPDSSALVVDGDGSLSLLLAEYADDADVPIMVQLLAAVALRSDDDEWVAETLAILDESHHALT